MLKIPELLPDPIVKGVTFASYASRVRSYWRLSKPRPGEFVCKKLTLQTNRYSYRKYWRIDSEYTPHQSSTEECIMLEGYKVNVPAAFARHIQATTHHDIWDIRLERESTRFLENAVMRVHCKDIKTLEHADRDPKITTHFPKWVNRVQVLPFDLVLELHAIHEQLIDMEDMEDIMEQVYQMAYGKDLSIRSCEEEINLRHHTGVLHVSKDALLQVQLHVKSLGLFVAGSV